MNLEKRLDQWVSAAAIDAPAAERIRQFERQQPSASWVLYGVSGLGIVVLMTGVVSVVAANWALFSVASKLIAYFAIFIAVGFASVRHAESPGIIREGLFTVFSLLVLLGIGLIGQTYELQGDGYQAAALWLLLVSPITLLARSRLMHNFWLLGLASTELLWLSAAHDEHQRMTRSCVILATPYLVLAASYAFGDLLNKEFARTARTWSFIVLLAGMAIPANIVWSNGGDWFFHRSDFGYRSQLLVAAVALSVIAAAFRRVQPGTALTAAITGTLVASGVLIIPAFTGQVGHAEIIGCALFIMCWSGAAAIAALLERKRLFDLSAFVIGVRFIVVYFEVFGSLAATGFGLILSGAVILGVAYAWHRYRGQVALALQEHR